MSRFINLFPIIFVTIIIGIIGCDKKSTKSDDCSGSYNLVCNIGETTYSFEIEGESGGAGITYDDHTVFSYDDKNQLLTTTVNFNRLYTYGSGNVYTITGVIVYDNIEEQILEWEIFATGGCLEDEVQSCKSP